MFEGEEKLLEREIRIDADPETVFAHLVDPKKLARWMCREAQVEPRTGGVFRLDVNGRDVMSGEVVEIVPNRKLVVSWGWETETLVPPGSTRVEITLQEDGNGTQLRLVHKGLAGADHDKHSQGWDHYLGRLVRVSEGQDPGLDPWGTSETHHS